MPNKFDKTFKNHLTCLIYAALNDIKHTLPIEELIPGVIVRNVTTWTNPEFKVKYREQFTLSSGCLSVIREMIEICGDNIMIIANNEVLPRTIDELKIAVQNIIDDPNQAYIDWLSELLPLADKFVSLDNIIDEHNQWICILDPQSILEKSKKLQKILSDYVDLLIKKIAIKIAYHIRSFSKIGITISSRVFLVALASMDPPHDLILPLCESVENEKSKKPIRAKTAGVRTPAVKLVAPLESETSPDHEDQSEASEEEED